MKLINCNPGFEVDDLLSDRAIPMPNCSTTHFLRAPRRNRRVIITVLLSLFSIISLIVFSRLLECFSDESDGSVTAVSFDNTGARLCGCRYIDFCRSIASVAKLSFRVPSLSDSANRDPYPATGWPFIALIRAAIDFFEAGPGLAIFWCARFANFCVDEILRQIAR